MKANLLYRCYDTIGEAVTWLPDMKTLLWVDIDSGILHQYNLESQKMEEHQFPEMITAVIPWKGHVNPEKPDVPLNKNDAFQKVQKRRVQEKR